ncbi:glutathionylspermidine synthase family protein [Oceanirhabdus sp. W0125-5]|uniref:glutathionylspermidine synthase family protein n=1 Tax=Oceanirhabdus sp. W0125-5 TaxID=2999116 RepID=UPI0022F3040B|nr:glutathionylspermidine synthase family protein [Oceanirhabdus sp. W0125-5]WBW99524.1 glutathionylspermidine synthase family protein [Oceanirhabdus sp. W0125-5]
MNRLEIERFYMKEILKNKEKHIKNYKEMIKKVKNSTAMYKGEPIPFLYMPKMYTESDLNEFIKLSETMMGILRKVIDRYLTNYEYRKEFRFGSLLDKLIRVEHGFRAYVPMARIDLFYKGIGKFKFCELNADGSSAMNEDRELGKIFRESGIFDNIPHDFNEENFELFNSWVKECEKMYTEFGGVKGEETTVAIVDWSGGGTVNEFKVFKKAFEENGFKAIIVDPRDVTFKESTLYHNDTKIDIVYRRLVTREIIDRSDEIKDFIEGCLSGKVCVIGPIKSQIIHNKRIFKILHDEETKAFLTDEEISFIEEHIPLTKYFEGDGWDINKLIADKDELILKPSDLYASRGVYAGKDFTDEMWREKLFKCKDEDYLIQEYYTPHKTTLLEVTEDDIVQCEFNNITGIYMYNEKMAGLYSRVGKNPIISGLHECYTLPTFIIKESE